MPRRCIRCCIGWRSSAGFGAAGSRKRVSGAAVTTRSPPRARRCWPRSGRAGATLRARFRVSREFSMRDWRDEIRRLLSGAKLTGEAEAEVVEELAQHLDDRFRELTKRGVTESEATRIVLSELQDENLGRRLGELKSKTHDLTTLGG